MSNRGYNIIIGLYIALELAAVLLVVLGQESLRVLLIVTPTVVLGIWAQYISKRHKARQVQQEVNQP